MRWATVLAALGLVLLGTGFSVGTGPSYVDGTDCGSVLFPAERAYLRAHHTSHAECRSVRGDGRLLATWGFLGLGASALAVAWAGVREAEARPAG